LRSKSSHLGRREASKGALVATDDGAATVVDSAVDLCTDYRASGIAHGDNGEKQM
jgi:hypothetical protein